MVHKQCFANLSIVSKGDEVYSFSLLDVQVLVLLFGFLIGYVGLINAVVVIFSITPLIKELHGGPVSLFY